MPAAKSESAPPLKRHKPTGQAYVILDGRRRYLGRFDDPATKGRYRRLVAEWGAGITMTPHPDLTVAELLAGFWRFAETYHRPQEREHFRRAARPLAELYGDLPVATFTPPMLKAVRQVWIDAGNARMYCNALAARVKRIFKWGVSEGLVPSHVHHGLQAVEGLRAGRTTAHENEPVRPVSADVVDQTVRACTPTLAAMIRLQQLTGMRPGELCILRTADVDTSGRIWQYTPREHKLSYRGQSRRVMIGPRAQAVLKPWLKRELEAFIFSPAQAERERLDARAAARQTPLSYGNAPGTNRVHRPTKQPGDRYDTQSYGHAIAHACRRAFPPPDGLDAAAVAEWHRSHLWTPNQLRHSFATQVRREFGVDLAGTLLGHAPGSTITAAYAERSFGAAADVALKIG